MNREEPQEVTKNLIHFDEVWHILSATMNLHSNFLAYLELIRS